MDRNRKGQEAAAAAAREAKTRHNQRGERRGELEH